MKGGPTVTAVMDSAVLDEDLRPVEPGSGVVGKIARGGNIPLEYYKDPEKTAQTFVIAADGKRYSIPGDFATVEADGRITLLGRGSVSINSGGEKIFPEEVEAAVKSHPAVYDAVVVGVPDERWGQRVAAVVQPREGETPDARGRAGALPHEAGRLQGAARAAPRRHACSARPAASPTTRGRRRSRPQRRSSHENPRVRHVRHRAADLRVQPLPRRRGRGEQGRRARRAGRARRSRPSSSRSS